MILTNGERKKTYRDEDNSRLWTSKVKYNQRSTEDCSMHLAHRSTGRSMGISLRPSLNQSCAKCYVASVLSDTMHCSLTGASVHGILQARVPEWVAISFSRESSPPGDRTGIS